MDPARHTIGGIVERTVLEAAFHTGPFGTHRLRAVMGVPTVIEGPIPEVTHLTDRHVEVRGYFVDEAGAPCGEFRRCVYRRRGDLELWLGGLEVAPSHRGGMSEFIRHPLAVFADADVRRVRATGGRTVGGYVLAVQRFRGERFELDRERLRRFGADGRGVGAGGAHVSLPRHGSDRRLARRLLRSIVGAAWARGVISTGEAEFLVAQPLASPAALTEVVDRDLCRRLLAGARWPAVIELRRAERA